MNVLTIADKDGKVVGRGHSDKVGDSVLGQANVKKALAGQASSGVEEGTVVKFSMRAGHPVKLEGQVVGSVTAGVDLSSDTRFVDLIKETMGVECTIFHGDTRVSTTIVREGKRAVGTKMDNPRVLETVLQQGKTFQSQNQILGKEYNTVYWPLRDLEGKIVGMLFIGKDQGEQQKLDGRQLPHRRRRGAVHRHAHGGGRLLHRALDRRAAAAHQRRAAGRHGPRRRASPRRCPPRASRSPTAPRSRPRPSRRPPRRSRRWPR